MTSDNKDFLEHHGSKDHDPAIVASVRNMINQKGNTKLSEIKKDKKNL